MKKLFTLILSLVFVVSLVGCSSTPKKEYDVYIYSNKAETAETLPVLIQAWEADYEARTGEDITVKVVAGADEGGQLLAADLNSENQPAVFTTRFSELQAGIDAGQLVDLTTTSGDFKTQLVDTINPAHLLSLDGVASYGIPENVEGYGFVVNKSVLAKVLGIADKEVAFELVRVASYDEFKALVEAITAALGGKDGKVTIAGTEYAIAKANFPAELNGVFSVMGAEKWTYGNHVFNVIYNLEQDTMANATKQASVAFAGAEAYYDLLTLKVNNMASIDGAGVKVGPDFVTAYTYDAGTALIGQGKALFLKQGNWAYGGIAAASTPEYLADLAFLPVKVDLTKVDYSKARFANADEAAFLNTSIPVFVPNYYALNAKVTDEERALGMDFLLFLNKSDKGVETQVNTFAFIPYYGTTSSTGAEYPLTNSLGNSIVSYMGAGNVYGAPFDGTPSGWMYDNMATHIQEEFMAQPVWGSYEDFVSKVVEPSTAEFEAARAK